MDRMRAANEKARRTRMRAMTIDAALREFEQLCREVEARRQGSSGRRTHPVGLVKYTRSADRPPAPPQPR